jgi:hypothetical protein
MLLVEQEGEQGRGRMAWCWRIAILVACFNGDVAAREHPPACLNDDQGCSQAPDRHNPAEMREKSD